ncbi:MAG: N-acetylmuramoyl-L-alanine amidase [Phycisphaeraceae bacterium]|nr:N-acetylmuramoyl-L-alanine amidase [Phycisphaeraceae bacterium]
MDQPPRPQPNEPAVPLTRRALLLRGVLGLGGLGALALSGCATSRTGDLPGPIWPDLDTVCDVPPPPPLAQPAPTPTVQTLPNGVLPRSQWARAEPICSLMNPMRPVRHITVHHDGLTPFTSTDPASTKARIEMIRNGHRGNGWGDIGYHFVIDREGRVWEGRAINWQGAHVKNWNEGNLGICCLGNFEQQSPSPAQLAALERQLKVLMQMYGVPKARVMTHQEWAGAKTACPGRTLQAQMVTMRKGSRLA